MNKELLINANLLPHYRIVASLMRKLSWTPLINIIYRTRELKFELYAQKLHQFVDIRDKNCSERDMYDK